MILAIDPGPTQSGYVVFDEHKRRVVESGVFSNDKMLVKVMDWSTELQTSCAIEMIASYGMAVGAEVFETCVWVGRFTQEWIQCCGQYPRLVYRKDVKMHLCGTTKAKDGNIRQRLIDMLGAPGTKKAPGPTYGLNSHMWPALAVAVTAAQTPQATP